MIATVVGRYYAMDRDKRWDRDKLAWDAIVLGRGEAPTSSPAEAVKARYAADETDEFLKPMVFGHVNEQRIRDGDVVLFFNFRARPCAAIVAGVFAAGFQRVRPGGVAEGALRDAHGV